LGQLTAAAERIPKLDLTNRSYPVHIAYQIRLYRCAVPRTPEHGRAGGRRDSILQEEETMSGSPVLYPGATSGRRANTLDDLPAEFNVPRERVRKIEVRAFEKVRRA
jgi:hypothetical protein